VKHNGDFVTLQFLFSSEGVHLGTYKKFSIRGRSKPIKQNWPKNANSLLNQPGLKTQPQFFLLRRKVVGKTFQKFKYIVWVLHKQKTTFKSP
jgi:hypothetical protein